MLRGVDRLPGNACANGQKAVHPSERTAATRQTLNFSSRYHPSQLAATATPRCSLGRHAAILAPTCGCPHRVLLAVLEGMALVVAPARKFPVQRCYILDTCNVTYFPLSCTSLFFRPLPDASRQVARNHTSRRPAMTQPSPQLWCCSNPGCRREFFREPASPGDGSLRCSCGGILEHKSAPPAFSYLGFLRPDGFSSPRQETKEE